MCLGIIHVSFFINFLDLLRQRLLMNMFAITLEMKKTFWLSSLGAPLEYGVLILNKERNNKIINNVDLVSLKNKVHLETTVKKLKPTGKVVSGAAFAVVNEIFFNKDGKYFNQLTGENIKRFIVLFVVRCSHTARLVVRLRLPVLSSSLPSAFKSRHHQAFFSSSSHYLFCFVQMRSMKFNLMHVGYLIKNHSHSKNIKENTTNLHVARLSCCIDIHKSSFTTIVSLIISCITELLHTQLFK